LSIVKSVETPNHFSVAQGKKNQMDTAPTALLWLMQ
jgi:hypothetical protein